MQVAVERVKAFSELEREAAEFVEPRPDSSWPAKGHIKCENLVIRYAVCLVLQSYWNFFLSLPSQPELPDILHKISFEIPPGEKVSSLSLKNYIIADDMHTRLVCWGEQVLVKAPLHFRSSVSSRLRRGGL